MNTLTPEVRRRYETELPDWKIVDDVKIEKEFKFINFVTALEFINRVGEIAEKMNHHPNFYLYGWNKIRFTLTTFKTGGLTSNDFIEAQRINELAKDPKFLPPAAK